MNDRNIRLAELTLVLVIGAFYFFFVVSHLGLWEPWESDPLLLAREMAQLRIGDAGFWVPMQSGALLKQSLLELWSLAAVFNGNLQPSIWMFRAPYIIVALVTLILTFGVLRRHVNRAAAWVSVVVLLTLPLFVLDTALIHTSSMLVSAVAIPVLLYLLILRSRTKRERNAQRAILAFSVFFAFLAGGFVALIFLFVLLAIFLLIQRDARALRPFASRYFQFPFWVAFMLSILLFNQYWQVSQRLFEHREPMTLAEFNEELLAHRVIGIDRRHGEVVATLVVEGEEGAHRDVIIASANNPHVRRFKVVMRESPREYLRFEHYVKHHLDGSVAEAQLPHECNRINALYSTFEAFGLPLSGRGAAPSCGGAGGRRIPVSVPFSLSGSRGGRSCGSAGRKPCSRAGGDRPDS